MAAYKRENMMVGQSSGSHKQGGFQMAWVKRECDERTVSLGCTRQL